MRQRLNVRHWIAKFGKAFAATPFYPYELEFKRAAEGQTRLLRHACGFVLNVGCGNDAIRPQVLAVRGITGYVALDYPFEPFAERQAESRRLFGKVLGDALMGQFVQVADVWADGNYLPIADNSVDTVLLLEVLEHIKTPSAILSEIARVLRGGGELLISVPFIYPPHGGEEGADYFRYTLTGLQTLLDPCGLTVQEFYPVGGIGTTLSLLFAHFLIRKVRDDARSRVDVWLRAVIALPWFLLLNGMGRWLDALGHWDVFADRYCIVAEKTENSQ